MSLEEEKDRLKIRLNRLEKTLSQDDEYGNLKGWIKEFRQNLKDASNKKDMKELDFRLGNMEENFSDEMLNYSKERLRGVIEGINAGKPKDMAYRNPTPMELKEKPKIMGMTMDEIMKLQEYAMKRSNINNIKKNISDLDKLKKENENLLKPVDIRGNDPKADTLKVQKNISKGKSRTSINTVGKNEIESI